MRDNGQDDDLHAACEAHGLVPLGDPTPQMICHQRLDVPAVPEGISLRAVCDEQGVADFAAVDTDAYATYGMPADVFVDMFDRPDRLLADVHTTIVVAYRGATPVATALTFLSGGVASLQWVGTIAAAREMGLGRIVTVWATNVAFDLGATSVTLQASPMGATALRQAGLRDVLPLPRVRALERTCLKARAGHPNSSRKCDRHPALLGRPVGGIDQSMGHQRLIETGRRRPAVRHGVDERPIRFHVGPHRQADLVATEWQLVHPGRRAGTGGPRCRRWSGRAAAPGTRRPATPCPPGRTARSAGSSRG